MNRNDAKAAVKVWGQVVARERGIAADPDPSILDGAEEITAGMRAKTLDAVALTLGEYRQLIRQQAIAEVFVAVIGGRTDVEYLLLVHRDSPVQSLADLKGRNLTCFENPRNSLALVWLDTLLAQQGQKLAAGFFGRVTQSRKLATAVLPVFFGQSDACVVDRHGFETLCELNPQVGKQLRVVTVSPTLVAMLFCLRAEYDPPVREKIVHALGQLHATPAGQQVLTVLQFDKIQRADPSCLQSGLELLARHADLTGSAKASNTSPEGKTSPASEGGAP